jgi:predicted esterase
VTIARSPVAASHGRYLIEEGQSGAAVSPLLVGFHGYAETAETQLERMRAIPGAESWLLVSVQGLHRFYRGRSSDVVASWMTRQDRDLMIGDNNAYVSGVVDEIAGEWPLSGTIVMAGFSQGVATAFRSACSATRRVAGVLVVGGDVPPDLDRDALARIPAAIIGRGAADQWYSEDQLHADVGRLRTAGVMVQTVVFDGGHEWPAEFNAVAGAFLASVG